MLGFTPLQIASSIVLLIGSSFVLTGVVTSYWNYYHVQIGYASGGTRNINASGHRGLIWTCHESHETLYQGAQSCISRFTDYSKVVQNGQPLKPALVAQLSYQPWEMATLVLLSMSTAFGFLSLLTAPLCCHRFGVIHSVFVYLAALTAIVGMGVFMGFQLRSSMDMSTQWMKFDKFGWSFVITVIGSLLQLIAAVLYTVSALCCRKYSEGYMQGSRQ